MNKKFLTLISAFSFTSCSTLHQQDISRYPASTATEQIINHSGATDTKGLAQINWRDLFYELNYINQLRMSKNQDEFKNRVYNSTYYTPEGFNAAYKKIISTSQTTKEIFQKREETLGINESYIHKMSSFSQLNQSKKLVASELIQNILNTSNSSKLNEENNYFKTPVGQSATSVLKDYVIVVVPGFGSHSIKDYTWPEILRHANAFYGRPEVRPIETIGQKNTFQTMEEFYGKNTNVGFDVIHPMGTELGFSTGSDVDSGSALANWLVRLKKLPAYKDKRFILIGYSKGTPISLNAFTNHPQISSSIAAIFTMAGVVQGSIPANSFIKNAYKISGPISKTALINKLESEYKKVATQMTNIKNWASKLLTTSDSNKRYLASINDMSKVLFGMGLIRLDNNTDEIMIADNPKTIEGINDLSNYESIQWNLKNYNNQKFKNKISIFNISMLTNVKDFMRPNPFLQNTLTPPLIVPQFANQNILDYRYFSKDSVFLYLTSISGFEESVGGMFDTQVAWLDTKSMALDERPLTHSLDKEQLDMLNNRLKTEGIILPSNFASLPRRNLLNYLAVQKNGLTNINFLDLGEFRGTHWDIAFEQVYKPINPYQEYYKHQFPRRALQASVIELLAIYKQLGGL